MVKHITSCTGFQTVICLGMKMWRACSEQQQPWGSRPCARSKQAWKYWRIVWVRNVIVPNVWLMRFAFSLAAQDEARRSSE